MLTLIALFALANAWFSNDVHPDFPCEHDPVAQAVYAEIWRNQQVNFSFKFLGLSALIEGVFFSVVTLLN